MSRNLPPHPNLDYLKKQAKELLHDLVLRDPGLKLADAQHTLAREYGFASWPKLKLHVESLSGHASVAAESQSVSDDERMNADGLRPTDSRFPGAPQKPSPFVGRWTANLSKSKRHPDNLFQSAMLEIEVVGDTVTIADVVVDHSGHEDHGRNTIQVDGNDHSSTTHGNGYVLMARWRGSHILETVARKDGKAAGWGTYEVSADGNTLTVSGDQQVIVLERM